MITEAVPYEEAAAFLEGKPAVTREVFDRLLPELKARAFTILGVESADALQAARDAIAAIPRGADWPSVKKEIAAALEPWMGEGAPARVEMLMRWHAYQAYSVANQSNLDANADLFPYRQYQTAKDGRVRASHAALEGVTLPASSPFWERHTPPWEYGCRCDVRGVTAEEADEIRAEDAGKPEMQRRVLDGPLKDQLERHGRLVRGDNEIHDVRTKSEKGETGPEWSGKDLRIPLDVLRSRYDADVWGRFADWAEGVEIEGGPVGARFSLWDWINGAAPAGARLAQDRPATAADLVAEVLGGKAKWTRAEAATLFERMRARDPRPASEVLGEVEVRWETPGLDEASVRGYVDDLLERLPRSVADGLPPLEIVVDAAQPKKGEAPWLGKYRDGRITLNSHAISSPEEARATAYHELMHWVHQGQADPAYRARIKAHFQARTAAGGKWVDDYAGRVYPWEAADPAGLEVPTVYFESLADPERAAAAFNKDPDTMIAVLSVFFEP